MTRLSAALLSERFHPMGNVVAEGVWNQLGRPELNRLTLLVREAVQNSWDARSGKNIRFAIDSWSLSPAHVQAYASFFRQRPPAAAYSSSSKVVDTIESIERWLAEPAPRLLTISDRGTTGLDGPTRADDWSATGDRNFVDFLRNIGQPPGRAQTGGTFGYGKAAFYLASHARTIVVYTRCRHAGRLQSRLTAAALTHNYVHDSARFTGRHWWGVLAAGEVIEPFVDDLADEAATALGLPKFVGIDCGTSIGLVAPAFDDSELRELGMTCVRHLWPKLKAADGGQPPVSLAVKVAGIQVPIPDPAKTPPYDAFWRAYRRLSGPTATAVSYGREKVGELALEKSITLDPSARAGVLPEHEVRPRHVALLRTPELIVKYLEAGRGLGDDQVGFVGVFRTDPGHDDAFARSEPPTHDDWQPSSVPDKRASGTVRTALKKVREACRDFTNMNAPAVEAATGSPLARLAAEFGVLAAGTARSGAQARRPSTEATASKKSRGESPEVKAVQSEIGDLVEVDGGVHAVFAFDVRHGRDSERTSLSAEVFAVLAGGAREAEPPKGRTGTPAGWWRSPRGARFDGSEVEVGPNQQGTWTLYVRVEANVALGAFATVRRIEESS